MKRFILKLVFLPERLVPWAKRTGLARFHLVRGIIDLLLFPADWRIVSNAILKQTGHRLNWFKQPEFSEWISRSKLTNRRRIHSIWADKLAVRDWLKKHGFKQYLARLLWRGFDLNDARKLALPAQFVIKANHTSGCVIIVKDSSRFDWDKAIKETKRWLKIDYAASSAEWQYRWIEPELFIEEFLEQPDGLLLDYKIHCFYGEPKMIQVIDRVGTHCECCYGTDWDNLAWNLTYPLLEKSIPRPSTLDSMCNIARSLSHGCRYVRIDLYSVAERVFFGETTLHPGGGVLPKISPPCERQMTKWLWSEPTNANRLHKQ
jgi:hypothetical protein